ncbi:RNA polymerase Rpc34 [Nannochloropsis gaditana]|uniref:RNA polymerase Rpc34 n=1 Tax=Nannochloropsis gaditana TaxID=72520 RepID=W7TLL4_9STRA|nr:RNA polymerase Rpc34 [Nannochloropsis gaditana]EWM26924.1 RNA polymerase Rpc34 [Nannochloropsis gaditana]
METSRKETTGAGGGQHKDESGNLREEFLSLCLSHAEGLRNEQLREHFTERYLHLVPIINSCLAENLIRCMKTESNELVYQAVDPNLAEKMRNLGAEQLLVYQVVEKAGNKGIWHKDIRSQTSLQQPALKKILKNLESRQLVKSTSSISSKTRKLYLLYDLEPAKEITGGPWYTEHEFDHEFIEELSRAIYHFIKQQRKPPSLGIIADYVRNSGVSKVKSEIKNVEKRECRMAGRTSDSLSANMRLIAGCEYDVLRLPACTTCAHCFFSLCTI